jgi:hypothetical protein
MTGSWGMVLRLFWVNMGKFVGITKWYDPSKKCVFDPKQRLLPNSREVLYVQG